ncbi:hypothetical protein R6Q57_012975 [Mikania cordata]
MTKAIFRHMPTKLEELINDINKNNEEKITCIIADSGMGWVLRVAQNIGIRLAIFSPAPAAILALTMSIQKLIDDEEVINCNGDATTNQIFFENLFLGAAEAADHIICNSTIDLEPGTFTLFPKMVPIGPLLATNRSTRQVGHFWSEDSSCLTWLDQQPVCSVIYVAFGSISLLDQAQFEELALGLELTKKPFLWVVRPGKSENMDHEYPSGYMDRIGTRGKVYFNKTYICDIWKTGVGLNKDDAGIVTREEIKSKVEELLSNNIIKENASTLQESVMNSLQTGNSSNKNFKNFIDWIKEGNNRAHIDETCK